MRSWIQRWVVASLVLAVALTWLNGRTVGYRCDCGAVARLVPVPDCHLLECHPDHHHADGCDQDEHDASGGADHSHNHPAVREQPEWRCPDAGWSSLPVAAVLPAPRPVQIEPTAATIAPALPLINFSPPPPRRTFLTSLLLI